jgi:hypothetical protein
MEFDQIIWLDDAYQSPRLSRTRQVKPKYPVTQLLLKPCNGSGLQLWAYQDYRLNLQTHADRCLTIGPEPSALTPGGTNLPSRRMARSLELRTCSETALQRQLWRFEAPHRRTSPTMPFSQ